MLLHSRRFTVWLVSFLAVLVIYFIYNRLSRTPPIAISDSRQSTELIADACDSNGSVGMMGEVGVGVVRNVRYTTLNAQKQIEREFGFEKLLHQDGNDWEIEKPYIRVYRRSFRCEISGERARVAVETAGGRVTPKEGLLTGDVKVRIWPQHGGGFSEAVMYLDDIAFVGDKSLFSTAGMVEFVSDDVRLVGTGMKLIYNGDAERLEFLQITKLRSLNIKRWSRGFVLNPDNAGTVGKTTVSGTGVPAERPAGQEYRCVLDSNVVIETPRERLLAEVVALNNIFVRGGVADDNAVEVAPSSEGAAPAAAEPGGDVAISCDGGVVITPMDSPGGPAAERRGLAFGGQKTDDGGRRTEDRWQKMEDRADGKTTFRGVRVDYDVSTGEAVATGPSQITFSAVPSGTPNGGRLSSGMAKPIAAEVEDKTREAKGTPARVAITAQRQARFEPANGRGLAKGGPASNKVVFEGDCRCTVSQAIEDATRQCIVLADKLEIDLIQKDDAEGSASSLDISRLIAAGGDVHLASTKKLGEQLLAGVEMKCVRMDYDAVNGNFIATGPGLIKVDNSQTDEPQKGLGRFSLRRKCYAFLRQFDSLRFDGVSNRLAADSKEGSLLVDYFPLVATGSTSSPQGGKKAVRPGSPQEEKVAMTASHVEADILETTQGRMELGDLVAKGAVSYEDRDNQFAGSEFVYDANNAVVSVRGSQSRPCILNGAIVDAVQYNLKTGKVSTRIKGPGAIR